MIALYVWWHDDALPWLRRWGAWLLAGLLALVTLGLYRRRNAEPSPEYSVDDGDEIVTELGRRAEQDTAKADRELAESVEHASESERVRQDVLASDDAELLERTREHNAIKRHERGGALALFVLVLAAAAPVRADAEFKPNVARPDTGELGFWIATVYWRETLADAKALPACLAATATAQSSAERHRRVAEDRKVALAVSVATSKAKDERIARQAKELRAWSRQPWAPYAGFTLGVLVTGLGALAVVSR